MWGDVAWRARGHAFGMPNACPGHVVAKAKAAPMGRQPRLGHAAASLDTSVRISALKSYCTMLCMLLCMTLCMS